MQVRPLIAATVLALGSVAALAQELDPRNDRMFNQPAAAASSDRTRESVTAEVRNLQATGQLGGVGELAAAPVTGQDSTRFARARTRAEVRAETTAWNATHKRVVGDFAGEPVAEPESVQVAQAPATRGQVKEELAQWRASHKTVVGEFN